MSDWFIARPVIDDVEKLGTSATIHRHSLTGLQSAVKRYGMFPAYNVYYVTNGTWTLIGKYRDNEYERVSV